MSAKAIVFSLLVCGAASAELLPPERSHSLPAGFRVLDENDASHDLRDLTAGAPSLLLPVFTRCTGTCPMTTVYLKQALEKAEVAFRVVVLSFDTEDAAKDLREFRERFALPARWPVVRSADGGATRAFLDQLDFHVMKANGGFDHPNQTFVFSPAGGWAGTLAGATFPADELRTALARAWSADDPGAVQKARNWLIRPEAWILLACAGVAISLAAMLLTRRGWSD